MGHRRALRGAWSGEDVAGNWWPGGLRGREKWVWLVGSDSLSCPIREPGLGLVVVGSRTGDGRPLPPSQTPLLLLCGPSFCVPQLPTPALWLCRGHCPQSRVCCRPGWVGGGGALFSMGSVGLASSGPARAGSWPRGREAFSCFQQSGFGERGRFTLVSGSQKEIPWGLAPPPRLRAQALGAQQWCLCKDARNSECLWPPHAGPGLQGGPRVRAGQGSKAPSLRHLPCAHAL